MPSDPPSVLASLALDPIFAELTLNCFRPGLLLPMGNTQYNIITQKGVSFF